MTKRRLLILGLVVCAGLAAFTYVCWFRPGGINRATVLRIRAGMKEADVEKVIGLPFGDHRSDRQTRDVPIIGVGRSNQERARFWFGDSGYIVVWYDADGTVNERSYTPASETWMDRICEWLGLN